MFRYSSIEHNNIYRTINIFIIGCFLLNALFADTAYALRPNATGLEDTDLKASLSKRVKASQAGAKGDENAPTLGEKEKQFVTDNLGWFKDVFSSYRNDKILSARGAELLSCADSDLSDFTDDLYQKLYEVITYFRNIPIMSREEIIEKFPQQYFIEIHIPDNLSDVSIEPRFVEGCGNSCAFCLTQRCHKMKSMPFPIIIMLAKSNNKLLINGYAYEPLFYRDICGALHHDVRKLFGSYYVITHGVVEQYMDVALENIKRMKESGENYKIEISVHTADVDYFRLKKAGKTEGEIIDYFVQRYLLLINEFIDYEMNVRFLMPKKDQYVEDGKVGIWARISLRIIERITKELGEEAEITKLLLNQPSVAVKSSYRKSLSFRRIEIMVTSPRAWRFAGDDPLVQREILAWTMSQVSTPSYQLTPDGTIIAHFSIRFDYPKVLLQDIDFDKLVSLIADDILSYRDSAYWNYLGVLEYKLSFQLGESIFQRLFTGAFLERKTIAEKLARKIIELNIPVPLTKDMYSEGLPVNRPPSDKAIVLGSIFKPDKPDASSAQTVSAAEIIENHRKMLKNITSAA